MSQPYLLKELVSNAFDFLETAIDEFNEKPKYSVVHFCTAVELILKARLMHEHWSLIVEGKPNFSKFKEGNFKSLNFKDLIPTIEDFFDEKISPDIKNCFKSIAEHRNKMVHFFHESDDLNKSEKIKREIAIEQSNGWYFLRKLLEKWSSVFDAYSNRIQALNYRMKDHHVYLQAIYDQISKGIEKDVHAGVKYRKCSSCGFPASKEKKLTDNLIEVNCQVCLISEWILKVECPDCEKENEISEILAGSEIICSCKSVIDKKILDEQLNTDPTHYDNYFDKVEVNCAFCSGYHTGIKHQNFWICLDCYNVEEHMHVCGWCSEGQIGGGDLEYSYQSGCEFCEGHSGWAKDD